MPPTRYLRDGLKPGSHNLSPKVLQLMKACAEYLDRVAHVQNVLRAILAFTLFMK